MIYTLHEWQVLFNELYREKNEREGLRGVDIWLHVMEEAGEVAKALRKEDYSQLSKDLPDVFAWLCTFANFQNIDLEEAIWNRFPGRCPYCLEPMNCVCIAEMREIDLRQLEFHQRKRNNMPETCEQWVSMFRKIYGNVNSILSRQSIGFHLMEEIGEVARSIRKKDFQEIEAEIADVFAWLLAILMKVPELNSLNEMTWDIYPGLCKKCHEKPCQCDPFARQ